MSSEGFHPVGLVGDDGIRVSRQSRGLVAAGIHGAQEVVKGQGVEAAQIMGRNPLYLAEVTVGVVGAQRRPMVVGAEIQVFILVAAEGVKGVYLKDSPIHPREQVVNGLVFMAPVHLIQHFIGKVDAVGQGGQNGIDVGAGVGRLNVVVIGVEDGGVPVGVFLAEVVQAVRPVTRKIDAARRFRRRLDGAVHRSGGRHRLHRFLQLRPGGIAGGGVGDFFRHLMFSKHLLGLDPVQAAEIGVGGHQAFPPGESVRIPGVYLGEVASIPEGDRSKGRKLGQLPLLQLGTSGAEKPKQPHHKENDHGKEKHYPLPEIHLFLQQHRFLFCSLLFHGRLPHR